MKRKTLTAILAGTIFLTGCPAKVYGHGSAQVEKSKDALQVNGIINSGDYDNNKDLNFEILTMNGTLGIQSLCTGSDGNTAELNTIRGIINALYEGNHIQNNKKREYSGIIIKGEYTMNKEKRVFEIQRGDKGGIWIIYKDGTPHHLPIV